jgi:hypothetical protein
MYILDPWLLLRDYLIVTHIVFQYNIKTSVYYYILDSNVKPIILKAYTPMRCDSHR